MLKRSSLCGPGGRDVVGDNLDEACDADTVLGPAEAVPMDDTDGELESRGTCVSGPPSKGV